MMSRPGNSYHIGNQVKELLPVVRLERMLGFVSGISLPVVLSIFCSPGFLFCLFVCFFVLRPFRDVKKLCFTPPVVLRR